MSYPTLSHSKVKHSTMTDSIRALAVFAIMAQLAPSQAANIVDPITGDGLGAPADFKEFEIAVKNEVGADQPLLYRVYRYGPITPNVPLLVHLHEYGGHFARMEAITKYERTGQPFVMLAFQWKTSSDNQRNWWYGRIDNTTKKLVPFAHNAIISVTQQAMRTSMVTEAVGSSIDTNRVYAYGHSAGGTGSVQLAMRHPEIFAAVSVNAGWTLYDDRDREAGETNKFRNAFTQIIGSTPGVAYDGTYPPEDEVTIAMNADQLHLPLGQEMKANLYTDLAHYFGQIRNPGWPSPPIFIAQGAADDVLHQGDNLVPALEAQRRLYTYNRTSAGHEGGGVYVKMDKMYKFRKDQSYLVFTKREYGVNSLDSIGFFNDLRVRGWDPATIIDVSNRYQVKLTGTGTSDVTIRRTQQLVHAPGTLYTVKLDGVLSGTVTADEWGLVTVPKVKDAPLLELTAQGVGIEPTFRKRQPRRPASGFIEVFPQPGYWVADALGKRVWKSPSVMLRAFP
jgi:Esterase PHB depolymerase